MNKILDEGAMAIIRVFKDRILLDCQLDGDMEAVVGKPINFSTLVEALKPTPITTGPLPPNCLHFEYRDGTVQLSIWIPAHKQKIITETAVYQVPLPPMILVGKARNYHLYALRDDGISEQGAPKPHAQIFWPPLSNIMGGGSICAGANKFPVAGPRTIWQVWRELWESKFTGHVISGRCVSEAGDIRRLWKRLDGQDKFPNQELVAYRGVHNVLSITGEFAL